MPAALRTCSCLASRALQGRIARHTNHVGHTMRSTPTSQRA